MTGAVHVVLQLAMPPSTNMTGAVHLALQLKVVISPSFRRAQQHFLGFLKQALAQALVQKLFLGLLKLALLVAQNSVAQ
eukprot:13435713-Alexandrium_andersonii.AAC.1